MYAIRFVYQDYRQYVVNIADEALGDFFLCLQEGKPYLDKSASVGFWLPPEGVRAAFITKVQEQPAKADEEPVGCQENPSSEPESDSTT